MTSFFAVGLIIAAAAAFGAVARNFKQPLILAYILVGIIVASFDIIPDGEASRTIKFLAELGVAFLLFLVGLELKIDKIRHLGKIAFITGVGQTIFTGVLGFGISRLLGFGNLESVYIALALSFSSTIIVVKLLQEKRDLNSLYGNVAVGFLIVQDILAIIALVMIASIGKGDFSASDFATTLIQGVVFIALTFGLSRYVAPSIFGVVAKNTELLFLSSIAWALIFASLAASLGFSVAVGAFLAGIGLSTLKEEHQIASRIRPLRDLFIVIFFISLGLQLSFSNILSNLSPALIFSLFVLIGNPLVMMVIMGKLGFRKRTSFMSSVTLAQISEFSLILVALGLSVDHLTQGVVSIVALVAIITISVSSYLILNSSKVYRRVGKYLSIFQGSVLSEKIFEGEKEFSDHIVLVGAGRLGGELLRDLRKGTSEIVVVEFNPTMVRRLMDEGVDTVFGDIADREIVEKANVKKAKLFLSTVYDKGDTEDLLEIFAEENIQTPIVVTAASISEALKFYQKGVSYVIIPRILSSQYVSLLLEDSNIDKLLSGKLREKHLRDIREKRSSTQG